MAQITRYDAFRQNWATLSLLTFEEAFELATTVESEDDAEMGAAYGKHMEVLGLDKMKRVCACFSRPHAFRDPSAANLFLSFSLFFLLGIRYRRMISYLMEARTNE